MKTSAAVQIEELRDEVARLGAVVAELEARLEDEAADEDLWNVWPYTWATAGYSKTRELIEANRQNWERRQLARYNRRLQRTFEPRGEGELKLV